MRAMSKDRDIDDILESLNQLLREGESHNDDHVESDEHADKAEQGLDELQDDLSDVAEMETRLSEAADIGDLEAADETVSEDLSAIDSEQETSGSWEADEPEEDRISDEGDQRLSVHRVVLTEEMLVDNPQRSLLSLVGNRADVQVDDQADEAVEPESGESETEPSVDHALMAELLDRITDDVIRQLPVLIKTSLEHHLNHLIQGEQSGGATDQTEE